MAHQYLRTTTAILAAIGLAACSSDGRVSFGAGSGVGTASAPNGSGSANNNTNGGGGSDSGSNNDGGSQQAAAGDGTTGRLVDNIDQAINDGSGPTLASIGNVGSLLTQSGESGPVGSLLNETGLTEAADATIDPLGRVSVGDEILIGASDSGASQSLGVSVLSDSQNQGDVASIGVLSNGQVVSVDTQIAENGEGDLLGVIADNDQVIGQGAEPVSVGVLSSSDADGDIASANVLNDGTIADVRVNATNGDTQLPVVGELLNSTLPGLTGN